MKIKIYILLIVPINNWYHPQLVIYVYDKRSNKKSFFCIK